MKALLPPARDLHGLQLQITRAGFGSPASVFGAKTNPENGFYFSYSVLQAGKKEDVDSLVSLNGLFAPDGAPIRYTGEHDATLFYPDVSPSWKSVRAELEVRNILSPPEDTGTSQRHHEVPNVALPAGSVSKTTGAPNLEFVTARGTKVRLEHLTRGQAPDDKDRLFVTSLWKIERPQDAPEAEVKMKNARIRYGQGDFEFGGDAGAKGDDIELQSLNVPSDTKTVSFSFDLVESARRWRKTSAFERVSFEIPVAAVWKIAPLAPQVPFAPSVTARTPDFEARWDAGYDFHWRYPEEDAMLKSRLWMRDLHPDPKSGAWAPKTVEITADKEPFNLFYAWAESSNGVFHADGSLKTKSETGYELTFSTRNHAYSHADLVVKAQRARTFITTHVLKDVPLPPKNNSIEFKPDKFFDGTWRLRRVTWLDDPHSKERIELSGGAALLLTFERDPKTYFLEDGMMLRGSDVFYDEKGVVSPTSSTFQNGDYIQEGHDKEHITMILSPPEPGTTRFSGNFQVQQQVWDGPVETLILRGVPIGVRPGVEAKA